MYVITWERVGRNLLQNLHVHVIWCVTGSMSKKFIIVLENVSILHEVLHSMLHWNSWWWCKGINYLNTNYLNAIHIWYRFTKSMCKICDWWSACISFIIDCKIDNACTQYTRQIITNINLHVTISEYIIKSNNRNILYDNDKKMLADEIHHNTHDS